MNMRTLENSSWQILHLLFDPTPLLLTLKLLVFVIVILNH